MGIGFVIFIHLEVIFLLSVLLALVSIILTSVLAKKENRKRKILFAGLAPFFGLYTFYFLGLFGSMFIADMKGIDIGIGDCWHVPVNDNCNLNFIDSYKQSYLDDDNNMVIENIEYIQLTEKSVLGKTNDSTYFQYDFATKNLQKYKTENELLISNTSQKLNFKKVDDFYNERRNEIAGIGFIIVWVLSFVTTIIGLWILLKLILGQFKETIKRLYNLRKENHNKIDGLRA